MKNSIKLFRLLNVESGALLIVSAEIINIKTEACE